MPLLNLSISQLLWVFVATNLLKKLRPARVFLKWIASRQIECFRLPSSEQLKKLAIGKSSKVQSQTKLASSNVRGQNKLQIRAVDLTKLELETMRLDSNMLWSAPYGEELEWVVDFALMSLFSYLSTQSIFYLCSTTLNEYNFSLLWVTLVILQCYFILARLTSVYFLNRISIGERSVCITSGCIFFTVAMLLLSSGSRHVELGLAQSTDIAPQSTSSSTTNETLTFDDEVGLEQSSNRSPGDATPTIIPSLIIRLLISLACSMLGIIFTFPGLRFGQLHEILADSNARFGRSVYTFNYLSPLLVTILWLPTASRVPLKDQNYIHIDDTRFDLFRLYFAITVGLVRFLLVPGYLRTFLASAAGRVERLRFRGGTTTDSEIQLTISIINQYINVVAMQYLLPTLICIFTSIMYLTLSDTNDAVRLANNDAQVSQQTNLRHLFGEQSFVISAEEMISAIRGVLSSDLPKNVFCFATWWSHFCLFTTMTAGVVYHKYLTH